jgi:hypothetical protein
LSSFNRDLDRLDQDVKGVISAISKLEAKDINADVRKLLESILKATSKEILISKVEIPGTVTVSNFPEGKEFPKEIKISNFPEQLKFPDTVKVSNFPDFPQAKETVFPKSMDVTGKVAVENQISLEEVIKGLQTVVDVINELRLEMPKTLSAGITSSTIQAPKPLVYGFNGYDDTSTSDVIYIANETQTGVWMIEKFNKTTKLMTYASPSNNKSIAGFSQAWAAKTSLTYDLYSIAR